jgi:hypothetical protein
MTQVASTTTTKTTATTPTTTTTTQIVSPSCPACANSYDDRVPCNHEELLICPAIAGDRHMYDSSITSLVNSALTRAEGDLSIFNNDMLSRIDFPSLSYVGGYISTSQNAVLTRVDLASLSYIGTYLVMQINPVLALASLPRLSHVQRDIVICLNGPSFVLPNPASGTAALPGLTSVQLKGQSRCYLQNGTGNCDAPNQVACP